MVQNVNPTFVKTPNRGVVQISTGTGTSLVTVYTGGVNGSKIVSVNAYQTSTGTLTLNLFLTSAATNYFLTSASAAANTAVQLLPTTLPIDSDGNLFVTLASTADSLTVQTTVTVPTATALVNLVTVGGDF